MNLVRYLHDPVPYLHDPRYSKMRYWFTSHMVGGESWRHRRGIMWPKALFTRAIMTKFGHWDRYKIKINFSSNWFEGYWFHKHCKITWLYESAGSPCQEQMDRRRPQWQQFCSHYYEWYSQWLYELKMKPINFSGTNLKGCHLIIVRSGGIVEIL